MSETPSIRSGRPGRRIRPKRVRTSPSTLPKATPQEATSVPAAAPIPPIDMKAWYDSANEYAALEEAEQRATLQAARIRKVFLYAMAAGALVFTCGYLRLSGRLTRTSLGLPTRRTDAVNPSASTAAPANAAARPGANSPATAAEAALASRDPAVAADLARYATQDLQRLHADEARAMEAYAQVTGSHFKGTEPVFATLNTTVIPSYARFVANAQAVHPRTLPVQVIHTLFVHSAEAKLQAFRHMQEGEKKPDGLWQVDARAELVTSNMLAGNFRSEINRMARAQGVKLP